MTEIEQCLNCKRPECNNCLGDITGGNRTYTPEIKAEAVQRHRSGQSLQKIAQDIRIPQDTIRYWIKKVSGQHERFPRKIEKTKGKHETS